MSLEELWQKALRETEIVRLPVKRLLTFGVTQCEYIFLASSEVNTGDTIVRKGKIDIDRPLLELPRSGATFSGFSSPEGPGAMDEDLSSFFYMRGISFPPFNYTNEPYTIDLFEGSLVQAERTFRDAVQREELISTGIVIGTDVAWTMSIILMACHLIDTCVDNDLKAILNRIRKRNS